MPMPSPRRRLRGPAAVAVLAVLPTLAVLFAVLGPLRADATILDSGLAVDVGARPLHGEPTIDGNIGVTAQALGIRAALDVLHGHLPLWNHFEGLGAPLLGEMQSAALFPPTWLNALPHGQAIEQAFLQFVAGLGTALFLRRFGLRASAALAAGVAFEVNGVFAWLRNAVYNPVALLPWLFLAIEMLRGAALAGRGLGAAAALGAVVAALALYAGFPEEVYLYAWLLFAWALFRVAGLPARALPRFAGGLALTALAAAALAAPLLVAFADYLGQAELGVHAAAAEEAGWSDPAGLVQYLAPYVYGTIFGSADPAVSDLWSGTGGYIGFVPLVLALAALLDPRRRGAKLLLAGWIVLAVGASHGAPGLHGAFTALPLIRIVAFSRYLDAGWIFCFVVLAALALDDVLAAPPRRRGLLVATGGGALCVLLAAAAAWPTLAAVWSGSAYGRLWMVAAGAAVAAQGLILAGLALLPAPRQRAAGLSALLVAEAVAWFGLPYLSYPRHGTLDLALVGFLRAEAGFQRVVAFESGGLSPNYGSAYGVSLLNYDDLPSPKLTADYVRGRLDPYAGPLSFLAPSFGLTPEQSRERRNILHARLAAYGRAGVRFVLSGADLDAVPPYRIDASREDAALPLAPGGEVTLSGRLAPSLGLSVAAVSVALRSADGASGGRLRASLCAGQDCAAGEVELAAASGERPSVALDRALTLDPGAAYTVRIARIGGEGLRALVLHPLATGDGAVAVAGAPDGSAPDMRFIDGGLRLAYRGRAAWAYRLSDERPYLSAEGCRLVPASRDEVRASCAGRSRLTRLEAAMSGWSATVDDRPVPITAVDDVFQAIDLPAGDSRVTFRYAPRGFGWALAAASLALAWVAVAGSLLLSDRVGRGGRGRAQADPTPGR